MALEQSIFYEVLGGRYPIKGLTDSKSVHDSIIVNQNQQL